MTGRHVIETFGLTKRFGQVLALDGLDLDVPRGSIFGLLGRNGAGKSTLIKILLGMARPTEGHAQVFGLPADKPGPSVEIRKRTGYLGDDQPLYPHMTVAEMIAFTAALFPHWRPDLAKQYLHRFDLPPSRKVRALSRGMRTKLALLLALCRGAELLVLDEPTSGLDPLVKEEVLRAVVAHACEESMTVFFSSHHIDEVEQIADHVAIIEAGRTLECGPIDSLLEAYRRVRLVFEGEAPQVAFHTQGVVDVRRSGRVLTVVSARGAPAIIEEAMTLGAATVETVPMGLKEIFLQRVGGGV